MSKDAISEGGTHIGAQKPIVLSVVSETPPDRRGRFGVPRLLDYLIVAAFFFFFA